ncbi:transglutaminase-like domain-containing protein [Rhodococcus tukisamuensis]|uniref:transglutaminase-like domain-containing protein n=1 Tax=Rhodococcus tukisamuensis TaxID=168276 RepID=UPI0009339A29|nr:transglutaminase family protein [Rhodococcus tukisamuensis]
MATTDSVLETAPPENYLAGNEFIDVDDQSVRTLALTLRQGADSDASFAKAAFEWVRDEVGHSYDVQDSRVTLAASEVLAQRVGLCYAKSHLLAALLRSEGVPAGLCYQRLVHGDGHVLHGLVAIYLDGAWRRQDPRGNKDGVDAQFSLDSEQLAWRVVPSLGEVDYPRIFDSPAPCVVEALRGAADVLSLYDAGLPTSL